MTIALVGLPTVGKTTVGRQLARRLCVPFVDLDSDIELSLGRSIREFFESSGEEAFRKIEAATLRRCLEGEVGVLATGGGVILSPENRALLRARTSVIYLRAAPEQLVGRVRKDTHRPLLQVADPLLRLRQLYAMRDPLYRETALFTVDTGRPSVPQLVQTICDQLGRAEPG